jgi:hypothetical protein
MIEADGRQMKVELISRMFQLPRLKLSVYHDLRLDGEP